MISGPAHSVVHFASNVSGDGKTDGFIVSLVTVSGTNSTIYVSNRIAYGQTISSNFDLGVNLINDYHAITVLWEQTASAFYSETNPLTSTVANMKIYVDGSPLNFIDCEPFSGSYAGKTATICHHDYGLYQAAPSNFRRLYWNFGNQTEKNWDFEKNHTNFLVGYAQYFKGLLRE